jgi:hypothetical protein
MSRLFWPGSPNSNAASTSFVTPGKDERKNRAGEAVPPKIEGNERIRHDRALTTDEIAHGQLSQSRRMRPIHFSGSTQATPGRKIGRAYNVGMQVA